MTHPPASNWRRQSAHDVQGCDVLDRTVEQIGQADIGERNTCRRILAWLGLHLGKQISNCQFFMPVEGSEQGRGLGKTRVESPDQDIWYVQRHGRAAYRESLVLGDPSCTGPKRSAISVVREGSIHQEFCA
jgi:hypothetical protein